MNKDTDGGLQPGRDPDDIDAAQAALNRMRDAAAARGEIRRAVPRSGAGSQKPARAARGTRGFSQFHGTGRDPLALGKVVGRLVAERGWSSPVAVGSVMAQWAVLVGPEISAHCTPESFTDTTLHVRTDSTAWATQLRLLSNRSCVAHAVESVRTCKVVSVKLSGVQWAEISGPTRTAHCAITEPTATGELQPRSATRRPTTFPRPIGSRPVP